MRAGWLAASGCLVAALSLGVAACGDGEGGGGGTVAGETLTIYSSLSLRGDARSQSESVVNGEKLALSQAGGKVGEFKINYVSLDASAGAAGEAEPGQVSANARKAAQDKTTIAYLGEADAGASALSTPILNEAGILQISPADTYVGLTRAERADKGAPDKYYPTGERNFGRVVPADHVQAAAQVSYMKGNGVKSVFILNDKLVYGRSLADQVASSAAAQGIRVLGNEGIDAKAADFRSLAAKLEASGAEAMFFGGIAQSNGVQLWKDVYAANPDIELFGPSGLAEPPFAEKIGPAEKNTYITSPTLQPKLYPASAQEFFAQFERRYGKEPEPYAIYGYEAMNVALEAIRKAGAKGNDRQAVIDELFKIKDRESVLGTYSIDENGDTTLTDYGAYRVKGGRLVFDEVIKAQT